jgi:hypothetical protein
VRGTRVVHVSSERSARVHTLTRFAEKQTHERVTYPAEQEQTTL